MFILLFYFYPRFETLFKTSSENLTPDFVIMAIPRTIQKLEREPAKPILPGIPVESDRLDLSSEVEIPEEIAQKSADSVLVFYYPELKYQNLPAPFDPRSLFEEQNKDSLAQYREYLAMRLGKMNLNRISIYPSTDYERELNKSMGKSPMTGITVPIDIGSLFSKSKDHIYPNRTTKKIRVENILAMHKKFNILESLWTHSPQTILDLYAADSISHKNTYTSLQQSLDDLIINGLVKTVKTAKGEYEFKPVYSHKEMVRIVAAFRYAMPTGQKSANDILTGVLQRLLDFN